jgi:cysteine desulfurase
MPKIYLDYAATTPLDPKVLRQMMPYLRKNFGNPSSIHSLGQKALQVVEESRQKVAKFLNCSEREIIFTGSATEANNMAIKGLVKFGHIITTKIEHHAISEPLKELEKEGVQVTYLPVDKDGVVILDELKKAIRKDTVLVSIMYANNEIGVVQPIAEIAKIIKEANEKTYFHTDAVQAVNYLDCDVKKLGVDLLTLSAHKIYGPKGVGALFIKKGTPLKSLIAGGGQEFDLRSGTENVAGIVGLASAIEEVQNPRIKLQNIKIRHLRDKLVKAVLRAIPDSQLNGSATYRLPNNANFTFKGAEGEALVIALDQRGIEVSTGSACSSKVLEASHVLLALGLSEEAAHGSLRVTLGRYTEEKDIEKFLRVLPQVLQKLRKFSGYKL